MLRQLRTWGKLRLLRTNVVQQVLRQARLYPKVLSFDETLDFLLQGKSISRFGELELELILGNIEGDGDVTQVPDPSLSKRLSEILAEGTAETCVVAIWGFMGFYGKSAADWCFQFAQEHLEKTLPYFNPRRFYGDARITWMINRDNLARFRMLWEGRKVVFVRPLRGRFIMDERLFDNISEFAYVDVPPTNAWSEYQRILDDCKKFSTEWMFFLAAGATATVVAFDLSKLGYQALDMGHLPNCLAHNMGEAPDPCTTPQVN